MNAEVRLVGAAAVSGEVAGDGYVVYRGALDGAHVLHRPSISSDEDFVFFEHEPANSELAYELTLGEGVRAVRLFSNTIELLDAKGVPRLRMAPPYLVDADGKALALSVGVNDCAVDRSAAPPWEHALVSPGTNVCRVHIGWASASVKYPLIVDPSWTTTASMVLPRWAHTSTVLNNGRVLVAGGMIDEYLLVHAEAELFDPALGVWTPTGPMVTRRAIHTATRLSGGRVLVVGGWNELDANASAELYDPSTGVWLPAGTVGGPRAQHTATLLANNKVLVAGGAKFDAVTSTYTDLASAELYSEATNSWSSTGSLGAARVSHTTDLLSGGKVLAAGGYLTVTGSDLASAELYDPSTGTWSTTGSMATARSFHASAPLPGGKVLVSGGETVYAASAEIFDPAAGTWSATGSMATARSRHTATRLPGSDIVLVAGGNTTTTVPMTATAELYNPATGTWSSTVSLNTARSYHAAVVLGDAVLVTGGFLTGAPTANTLASTEIYDPL